MSKTIKKLKPISNKEFESIYDGKAPISNKTWKSIYAGIIEQIESFSYSNSFWYIGDFKTSSIVAVGGDIDVCSPISKKEWIGLNPMEIGKLFHPLDMAKMQAYTYFIAGFLSQKTEEERENIKISMIFRMLDSQNKYTWRLMQYPKMHYENNMPVYVMCHISDHQHLNENAKCTMFIADKNSEEKTLFYCDEEIVNLKEFANNKPLSEREIEVLKLLAKGLISKEIAEVLKISKNTVENHKQNMFVKTGTKKLTELVTFANKHFSSDPFN